MRRIHNIVKIGDINESDISNEVIKFLQGFIWYEDAVLSEDLLNVADAISSDHFKKLTDAGQLEIKELFKECKKKDCAYIRIIYENEYSTN